MECVNELLENAQVVERVEDWQSAPGLAQPLRKGVLARTM